MNIGKIKALVVDNGMNVDLARFLGKTYDKVFYFSPWQTDTPFLHDMAIGSGFPEIERVKSWLSKIDDVDIIVFPDLYYAEEQKWLRANGYAVWGSGDAEELELDRVGTKKIMASMKLPVWPYEECEGFDELTDFLEANKDVWVKFSRFRAHFETFHSENIDLSMVKLMGIFNDLLPYRDKAKFLTEKSMDKAFEIAIDTFFCGGRFPSKVLQGIEVKNLGYVGMVENFDDIPKTLTEFDRMFAPYLAGKGYCNFWSAEKRTGKDGVSYMNDVCARAPSPPSETYPLVYTNLGDIIARGAGGEFTEPEIGGLFASEMMIYTENPLDWNLVQYPKELEDNFKFRNRVRIGSKNWIVPKELPNEIIGSVVAVANTKDEAVRRCADIAKTIKGNGIYVHGDALEMVDKEIEKALSFGLSVLGE